eukprot:CAMPEP_0178643044 /NCGR_PEP_ID=MMETSP0698-20121128/17506_1 /TAXON_ID=265572 /ORGANISM="Extubocellulus spinifer, Strain CCMP396" /LENGTH=1014 /DNA_ID=CAMNT_0020283857 /DNA_START=22 /DNA_END=3066 /DNA_ORIENTATION=-
MAGSSRSKGGSAKKKAMAVPTDKKKKKVVPMSSRSGLKQRKSAEGNVRRKSSTGGSGADDDKQQPVAQPEVPAKAAAPDGGASSSGNVGPRAVASAPVPAPAPDVLRANGKRVRRKHDPNSWASSIPTQRTNVLCLGVSYPFVKHQLIAEEINDKVLHYSDPGVDQTVELVRRNILTEMDGRDLVRCLALEAANDTHAYCVSLENGARYGPRHLHANFNRVKFIGQLKKLWGNVKFRQIILDYFWIPRGTWVMSHWARSFFDTILPSFVTEGILDFSDGEANTRSVNSHLFSHSTAGYGGGVVYLPFCLHCIKEVTAAIKTLSKYYSISFLYKSELREHALWSATNSIDPDAMQNWFGKAIDQEETYCTFTPQEVNSSAEAAHISKSDLLQVLRGIENFGDVRMIKLTALKKYDPEYRGSKTGGIVGIDKGGFVGLKNPKEVKKGFDSVGKPTKPISVAAVVSGNISTPPLSSADEDDASHEKQQAVKKKASSSSVSSCKGKKKTSAATNTTAGTAGGKKARAKKRKVSKGDGDDNMVTPAMTPLTSISKRNGKASRKMQGKGLPSDSCFVTPSPPVDIARNLSAPPSSSANERLIRTKTEPNFKKGSEAARKTKKSSGTRSKSQSNNARRNRVPIYQRQDSSTITDNSLDPDGAGGEVTDGFIKEQIKSQVQIDKGPLCSHSGACACAGSCAGSSDDLRYSNRFGAFSSANVCSSTTEGADVPAAKSTDVSEDESSSSYSSGAAQIERFSAGASHSLGNINAITGQRVKRHILADDVEAKQVAAERLLDLKNASQSSPDSIRKVEKTSKKKVIKSEQGKVDLPTNGYAASNASIVANVKPGVPRKKRRKNEQKHNHDDDYEKIGIPGNSDINACEGHLSPRETFPRDGIESSLESAYVYDYYARRLDCTRTLDYARRLVAEDASRRVVQERMRQYGLPVTSKPTTLRPVDATYSDLSWQQLDLMVQMYQQQQQQQQQPQVPNPLLHSGVATEPTDSFLPAGGEEIISSPRGSA